MGGGGGDGLARRFEMEKTDSADAGRRCGLGTYGGGGEGAAKGCRGGGGAFGIARL